MTAYPLAADLAGAAITEGTFQTAITQLIVALKETPGGNGRDSLTIASGAVVPTTGVISVDGPSASNNLTNIVPATIANWDGKFLFLTITNASHVIVLKHLAGGSGAISLAGAADYTISKVGRWIALRWNNSANYWEEIFRDTTPAMPSVAKVATYSPVAADRGVTFLCTGTFSLTFTAVATLGADWFCYVKNEGTGVVTLDPNAAELVDGLATVPIAAGYGGMVSCTGTALKTLGIDPLAVAADIRTGTDAAKGATSVSIAGLWKKGTDIASATTLVKPSAANVGGYHIVTGTTPVTAIWTGETDGTEIELEFSGLCPLTHHATNFILPGGVSIVTAVGDKARFRSVGGLWRCVSAPPSWFGSVARPPVEVRQTVLSGPNTNGLPNFGGAGGIGTGTVTASGTLVVTAAAGADVGGQIDRVGSIVNPSWPSLTSNGVMYLYLDIAANGVCTPGSTTVAPIYQLGGTPAVTANQFTFNVQEMTGYVGNATTAPQTYRVFIGEVLVAAAVVSTITWYAIMGRYFSGFTQNLPGTSTFVNFNHNLGIYYSQCVPVLIIECTTTDNGFAVGDQIRNPCTNSGGSETPLGPTPTSRNTMQINTGQTAAAQAIPKGGGAITTLTQNSWKYAAGYERGF